MASAHVGHVGMCIAQLWTTFPGVLMDNLKKTTTADLKKMFGVFFVLKCFCFIFLQAIRPLKGKIRYFTSLPEKVPVKSSYWPQQHQVIVYSKLKNFHFMDCVIDYKLVEGRFWKSNYTLFVRKTLFLDFSDFTCGSNITTENKRPGEQANSGVYTM